MSKRKVRKNRKIKFSEEKYFEKYYLKDGKGVIPIKLDSFDDLYMKHDYLKRELSDEVCNYIEEIAYIVPINTDIVLEIHSKGLNEEEKEIIRKSIKSNYGMEIDDVEYDMKEQDKRSLTFLAFGFILLIINYIVDPSYNNFIFSNFLSIVWWLGVWDALEIQLYDKVDNRNKRLNYQQLYEASVVFIDEE